MCYKCHDRNSILGAPIGPAGVPPASAVRTRRAPIAPRIGAAVTTGFPHWSHVVKDQAPCAVCHDAHGSRANAHLIDFMTRDAAGTPVVSANSAGQLGYVTTGLGHGTCSLKCHGTDHAQLAY